MQFHSDRFKFDFKTNRLVNKMDGKLPDIVLKDKYYKDVKNVLDSFTCCSILNLKSLKIEGKVLVSGMNLKGDISIINKSKKIVDVGKILKRKHLGDEVVCIDESGILKI